MVKKLGMWDHFQVFLFPQPQTLYKQRVSQGDHLSKIPCWVVASPQPRPQSAL